MKVDVFELTVEDGGILYDMEDLLRLSNFYQILSIKEYLFENYSQLSHERAYEIAVDIWNDISDSCDWSGCEWLNTDDYVYRESE